MLGIIHRTVFYLEHKISETGFGLHLEVDLLSWVQSAELVSIVGIRDHLKRNSEF
jgi:hypothetical protein